MGHRPGQTPTPPPAGTQAAASPGQPAGLVPGKRRPRGTLPLARHLAPLWGPCTPSEPRHGPLHPRSGPDPGLLHPCSPQSC